MVELILQWAQKKPWFDTDFVEEMDTAISRYGSLTVHQRWALENIIERYHIK